MRIPYAKQTVDQEDIDNVVKVLQSDWLTQGPAIQLFERAVADYCGAKYAVAVNSATAALHIACLAAGLDSTGIMWTSPNTFVASANCGIYCGSKVDFVDIDAQSFNMSIQALEHKLKRANLRGQLPQVVIPVHFGGASCDMATIKALSKQYGFKVIEDASHAIGGSIAGYKVGSCRWSDMTVLSFHPVKIITTGEGGMVLTNDYDLYEKLQMLRSHGITRNPEKMMEASHGPWYYQQVSLGYNYRMTDIQAALGHSQLKKIDQFIARRQEIAQKYKEAIQSLPLKYQRYDDSVCSAYHLFVISLEIESMDKSRRQIVERLHSDGIMVNVHYIPIHTQPYYQSRGFKYGDFPVSERCYAGAISLPMYYGLSDQEQDYVIQKLKECFA